MVDEWNRARNVGKCGIGKKLFPGRLPPPHTQRCILIPYTRTYLIVTWSGMTQQIPCSSWHEGTSTDLTLAFTSVKNLLQIFNIYIRPAWKSWVMEMSLFSISRLLIKNNFGALNNNKTELKRVHIFKLINQCNIHHASPRNGTQINAHITPSFASGMITSWRI
jgi:hypothetical protein